jgi:hypothetical protein
MIHDAGRETKQMQNFLANAFIHHESVLFISTGEKCSSLYRKSAGNLAENPANVFVQLVRENSQNIENPGSLPVHCY